LAASLDRYALVGEQQVQAMVALQVAPLPFDMPAVQISLIWHRQQHHDPAHSWLREQLHGLLA
ncbi:MAG: LysR family transcriptional regulator, partial [Pseudomonas sp.]|nr:LysR family transcriptional regulator [Pseudomonas sp.]